MHERKLADVFPNTCIVLRILLTIPVTVASNLRLTMTQERLTNLAILSIERDVAETLNYSTLIDSFASAKACKIIL